ncbi:MAG: peptidylprolyl isomerase [Phycisphaerales bacterium]|jgi:peptidyl-prolyl cis-trans isomerase B (cyclophilin B)|nr:peptidylprolyl isomerase [Phycisphaerales bacterium]
MTNVLLKTTAGDITLALDETKAPITVANFLSYVDSGHYNNTVFHRVINGFMIQGGGFTPDGKQKPTGKAIKNEWNNGLNNDPYTVAMARLSNPDSATAQFFINVNANTFLSTASPQTGGAGYAVFGKVIAGTEVVDAIKTVRTASRQGMGDWPVQDIIITEAKRA